MMLLVLSLLGATPECDAQISKTRDHVQALAEGLSRPTYGLSVDVLEAEADPYRDDHNHVVVEVTDRAIRAGLASLSVKATAAQVRDELRKARKQYEVLHAAANDPVPTIEHSPGLLIISPQAPWSAVVAAAEGLRQHGVYIVQFLFQAKGATGAAKPEPTPFDARLYGDGTARPLTEVVTAIREVSEKVYSGCPKLAAVKPPSVEAEATAYLKQVQSVLPECGCGFDYPGYRALTYAQFHRVPHAGVTLELLPRGTVVSAKKNEKWSSAASLILAAAKADRPVRLVAK